MKWLFSLASAWVLLAVTAHAASQPVRVVSFNIRYAASSLESGEKPWWDLFCGLSNTRCRQVYAIQQLADTAANAPAGAVTVFGLQEVLDNQLTDIKNGLGDKWSHIGVGRDDGAKSGEYSPILYRNDALRVLYSEVKWLSPTPDVVSYGWGAGSRRIVTIAVFESIATGKRFLHANTHLDNVSSQARSEGIKVVLARIRAVRSQWGGDALGVSLTGDFNSQPGADAYQTLINDGFFTKDVYATAVASGQVVGPYGNTYTGFSSSTTTVRLDYVWVGPTSSALYAVQRYEILNNVVNGVYISDHRAVVADVTLL